MKHLSLFSWGFWGWGTATDRLLAAVNAAEKQRGFNPPVFVDIRYRRSGRAPGFKDDAFEKLLGWRRYRWMPSLGNSSIGTRKAMRIACPESASQLLDVALEAADRSARVIFFCACESPWRSDCHRHEIAKLLLRSARRRGLFVDIQEWPGGKPSARLETVRVPAKILRDVAHGAKTVPLNTTGVPVKFTAIPWGTLLRLKAGPDEYPVAVGPAAYRGRWVLPRFQEEDSDLDDIRALQRQTIRLRRALGLDVKQTR